MPCTAKIPGARTRTPPRMPTPGTAVALGPPGRGEIRPTRRLVSKPGLEFTQGPGEGRAGHRRALQMGVFGVNRISTTGLLGGTTFLLVIATTLLSCRQVRLMTRGKACPALDVLAELSFAIRPSLLLLLFEGFALHNVYRFNYLWLAAFSLLAAQFAASICASEETAIDEVH